MLSQPDQPTAPGDFIRNLLRQRGWTQKALALALAVEQPTVSKIVQGKRTIDAALALQLSDVFGLPAEQFLAVQQAHDLAEARRALQPDPRRAMRARLHGDLPVAEMVSRGWLATTDLRDAEAVEGALVKFFGVNSPEEIAALPHAARKSDADAPLTLAQLAWLYRVRAIAAEMVVPRYSPKAVREAVETLSGLLLSVEEARKVPRILAEAGVRFVLVEALPGSKLDGVCFWLNDMSPVVGMTMRHDRIDNFYFVLRHELEHVLRGHGRARPMVDAELEGERASTSASVAEEERVANAAAADFCVPAEQMARFWARKAPYFAERDILGFAATIKVHPGLVAGQLQHRTGRYDRFRSHLVRVRSAVAPSAAVDGWGDVFPVGS